MLLNLINDILDFSKIEAGKIEVQNSVMNFQEVIESNVLLFKELAREKNLNLSFKLDHRIPKYLVGDSNRVGQVLSNLINNAIKFTDKGSVNITVSLSAQTHDKVEVLFEISDTGSGISVENLKKIFSPFTQVDQSSTKRFGGTGLGLAICKNLIEIMGGEIGVRSNEGLGSTFWFKLHFVKSLADEEIAETKEKEWSAFKGIRILVCEDNLVNQTLMKKFLEVLGCDCVIAENGKVAVELIEANNRFDLIFMDCQMPEMDGFDASQAIRILEKDRRTPIVALTANAMEGDRDKCLNAGMDDFLSKPVFVEKLRQTIEKWCSSKQK